MRRTCSYLIIIASLQLATASVAEDEIGNTVYKAPTPEPTVEETLILEYINRARANPKADAERILKSESQKRDRGVDWKMFKDEMAAAPAVPPLVMDLDVLKAARWHSYYMTLNGQCHSETPDTPGYTAVQAGERMKLAGANGRGWGENCFSKAQNAWNSHCGFMVDYGTSAAGKSKGGMQDPRGHRNNILGAGFRLLGGAAVPTSSGLSVTHNFTGSRQRYAGGVVYNDKNHNDFYDAGEGIGGITISCNGQSIQTWKSGAYALPLPNGDARISVTLFDKKYSQSYTGNDNVKFDVPMPSQADLAKPIRLLTSVQSIPDTPATAARRRLAVIALYMRTREGLIDDASLDAIKKLTADIAKELNSAQDKVRDVVAGDDITASRKLISELSQPFARSEAMPWFSDADKCATARGISMQLADYKAKGTKLSGSILSMKMRGMESPLKSIKTPEWDAWLTQLIADTRALWKDN